MVVGMELCYSSRLVFNVEWFIKCKLHSNANSEICKEQEAGDVM
jgi:hypothetical protein